MAFDLRKWLEGAVAEVNPFDGGKNFASVNNAPKAVSRPATTAKPLQVTTARPTQSLQVSLPKIQPNLTMGAAPTPNVIAPIKTQQQRVQEIKDKQAQESNKYLKDMQNIYSPAGIAKEVGNGIFQTGKGIVDSSGNTIALGGSGLAKLQASLSGNKTMETAADEQLKEQWNKSIPGSSINAMKPLVAPLGASIAYNQERSKIENNPNYSPEQKTWLLASLADNLNQETSQYGMNTGQSNFQNAIPVVAGGVNTFTNIASAGTPGGYAAGAKSFAPISSKTITSNLVNKSIARYGNASTTALVNQSARLAAPNMVYGAVGGLTNTMVDPNATVADYVKNIAGGTLGGGIMGTASPFISAGLGKAGTKINDITSDIRATKYLNSPEGRAANHPSILGYDPTLKTLEQQHAQALENGQTARAKQIAKAYQDTSVAKYNEQMALEAQFRADAKKIGQSGSVPAGMFDPSGRLGRTDYRASHQIDTTTSRNLGDIKSVDDIVGTIKGKYGLSNYDQKDISNLKKIIGNPEADVKIYRSSPVNEINNGDWVTTSKTYANDIKAQNGGKVYEYTVKAKDLNLPNNIEDNPSLARFSAFQYNQANRPRSDAGFAKIPLTKKLQDFASRNLPDETGKLGKETPDSVVKQDITESIDMGGMKIADRAKTIEDSMAHYNKHRPEMESAKTVDELVKAYKASYDDSNMGLYDSSSLEQLYFKKLRTLEGRDFSSSVKPQPVAQPKRVAPIVTKTPTELPIVGKPLSQPVDNIPQIAKQVTASQKTNVPKTAKDTTTPQTAVRPVAPQVLNKKVQSSAPIITKKQAKLNDKAQVTSDLKAVTENLSTKYDAFEKSIYGDSTSDIKGGTKGANIYQQEVRKGKEAYNNAISKGMSSENGVVRNISRGIRTLFGSAGDTAERISRKGAFRGGIDESINLANDFKKLGDTMLPDDASRERVWAVLDPELATIKVDESSLNPAELKALQAVRQASDLINDTNFSMGKISHETWLKGKDGKYLTRAYEEFDVPSELKDSPFTAGKGKLDTGGYKQRKDVDEWKQENAIKDPFYLASKRIQSTMRNKSITDYATWINKNADMVSDTPKKGYTQLSESTMWGELSGKNVRHDVLTDMKGFYSDSKALQGGYDLLNAYDRFAPRQLLKTSKTVLNPATRLGNQISNRVFAALNGVNIAKFEWNMHKFAPQELANNGKYARLLRKEGILGTDMTKFDLAKTLVKDGVEQSKINKVFDKIKSSYGAADDKAKLSAFKYWLDKGKTVDEAVVKVRNGFQDYSKVGLLYDIGAKTPLVGKSFIRFQSELARIIKNSATENPLALATVVGSIALTGEISSRLSGETPEDKATREGRFGTPVIPFTQIPLVFQTPIGEVNVARMFGMYETAGADTKNKNIVQRASKYLPFDVPTSKEDVNKMLGNDVLLGGIANQITDTDFRGKSISDPNSNKYQPSTLTDAEKAVNRAGAAYHNYQLPVVNDIENLGRSVLGEKDQYGRVKTPLQAGSKLTGFKVEQFGAKEAQAQREKDAVYAEYDRKDLQAQINSVIKDQAEGKIDASTAQKRIDGLSGKTSATNNAQSNGKIFSNPNGGFSYLDDNGSLQTEKTQSLAELAVKKSEFEKSDKNVEIIGNKVLRKDKEGKAYTTSKADYDYQLGTAKLSQLKRADNASGWIKEANKQLDLLDKQLNDPNVDPLDAIELLNKADALQEDIKKYTEYGGFTKPKAAKKTTSNTSMDYAKGLESSYADLIKNNDAVRNLVKGITIKRRKI